MTGDAVSPIDDCPCDDDALEKRILAALGRADGLHSLAERLVWGLLRVDMPSKLADLARVPEENRDGFLLAVFEAVIEAWEHNASREIAASLNQNEVLSRAIGALRAARQALADLNEERNKKVESNRLGGLADAQFWWRLSELTAAIEQGMDRFFEWTRDETEPPRPRAHLSGRRRGTVKNPRFRVFVWTLTKAAKHYGGRLGLQKNIPEGALLEAIKIVTPHLPDGFVPKRLSASTLQNIIR